MLNKFESIQAPFIRVFYKGNELKGVFIKRLQYTDAESEDDTCEIEIETQDRDMPSRLDIQEKLIWVITWGYISGQVRSRMIRLTDIKWVYSNTITANIKGTDLGSVLKADASRRVWKNTNILAMAAQVAGERGLDLHAPTTKKKTGNITKKDETPEKLEFEMDEERQNLTKADWKKITKLQKVRAQLGQHVGEKDYYSTLKDQDLKDKLVSTGKDNDLGIDNTFVKQYGQWKHYDAIPQAGKSTLEILRAVGAVEPGGPYLIETRDNKLILRKRSFNQTPYKTYEYGGSNSELISFEPESKVRSSGGSALKMGHAGWNKLDKTHFSGETAPGAKPGYVLSELLETEKAIEAIPEKDRDHIISETKAFRSESGNQNAGESLRYGIASGDYMSGNRPVSDNTRVVKLLKYGINMTQELAAVKEGIKAATAPKITDPKANNPLDSFSNANNLRSNAELEMHPASAKIVGDPLIETGMIVTIIQVSKKYMGNYYVSKVTDEVDGSGGYITTLELKRHGHNVKYLKSHKTARELGSKYNSQAGDRNVPEYRRHKVNVKRN